MSDEGTTEVQETEAPDAEALEATATGETDPGSEDDGSSLEAADKEDLLKEVQKLRRENAKRRTDSKKVEEAAKKWQEHVDSQKTELERLADRNKELETAHEAFQREKLQAKIAKEQGVDPDLADLIVGADEDEMVEKAKRLAEKTSPKKVTATDLHAGKTAGKTAEANRMQFLDDLFN